ncbi:Sugar phosphate permease [Tistlia consotensis]|uniref:Sugar phosphate permease n=1 Tax=Tistlia consotensis USBA 355 TaxID=560819 RepID=A0A1Y6CLV4_9PROT|nr:MFS transporter [Tistlia consotensis]SMF73287.1 Sugar phosphate permease [Tistlia consotensis USBA 355]SNS30790.1 Sugar phosphate permease [Tistlia consotensis]
MTAIQTRADPETSSLDSHTKYALCVLMLSCSLSFLDRQVVNILAEPIKKEFGLSDTELGILTGMAFALFHAALTLPMARIADRANRVLVIAGSMTVWSLATAASGLAAGFGQLLAARMFVGVGEAGGIAPAHALIADTVPKRKRATAIAFYSAGIPLGGLLGLALGGLVLDSYGWRAAFFVASTPGLVLAPLMLLTIGDPARSRLLPSAREAFPPLGDAFREIFSKKAFLLVTAAGAAMTFVNFGQAAFLASFFFRVHGEALASMASGVNGLVGTALGAAGLLGLALGCAKGLAGMIGSFAGGWLTDRLDGDGYRAYALVPALIAIVRIPLFTAALLVPDTAAAFTLMAIHFLVGGMGKIGGFAAVQGLVTPRVRATAAAVYGIGINLVGLGLGPLCVGLSSDSLSAAGLGAAEGLRWTLVATSAPLLIVALLNWHASRHLSAESVS